MNKSLTTWIAKRYFLSKKQVGLISFTSYISIIGIALGSFALIVTLSVLNGFEAEITERTINVESHIRIEGSNLSIDDTTIVRSILPQNSARSIYPFILKKAVITANNVEQMVRLKAVDEKVLKSILPDANAIFRGTNTFSSLFADLPGIVIGYRLADKLGIHPGDTLFVINPMQIGAGFGLPQVGQFIVTGIFKLDLFDYDDNYAFIALEEAKRIFSLGNTISGIDIHLNGFRQAEKIKSILRENLNNDLSVNTWMDLHQTLYGAMLLEKYGSFVALSFIVLVAIFNLASSLVMLIMEKIKEIGILQILGLSNKGLKEIFLKLGFIIGSIGLAFGTIIGLIICILQEKYHFIPLPSVYFVPYLPIVVNPLDVLMVITIGLVLIYLGVLYPMWKLGKLLPLETIQYEK